MVSILTEAKKILIDSELWYFNNQSNTHTLDNLAWITGNRIEVELMKEVRESFPYAAIHNPNTFTKLYGIDIYFGVLEDDYGLCLIPKELYKHCDQFDI